MATDFLQLAGKRILVMGVANRKSVAWHVSRVLVEAGAEVVYAVRNEARREQVQQLVGDAAVFVCDVEFEDQIERLAGELVREVRRLHGFVHSIAFADYAGEPRSRFTKRPSGTFCGRSISRASRWSRCPTR